MLKCWHGDPEERPTFSELVRLMSQTLESLAGYMDVSTFGKIEVHVEDPHNDGTCDEGANDEDQHGEDAHDEGTNDEGTNDEDQHGEDPHNEDAHDEATNDEGTNDEDQHGEDQHGEDAHCETEV